MPKPHIHAKPSEQVVTIRAKTLHDSNDEYKAIMNPLRVDGIKAPLPETFSFGTVNEVNELFDIFKFKSQAVQFISGGLVNANYDRGFAERSFWRSLQNQEMTVELEFNAYYSGAIDVVEPVQNLMLLAAPVETLGTATTGKATSAWGWNSPPHCTITYGRILYFTDVLIKSVSVVFSNKLDANFDPMAATVTLTYIPANPIGYAGIRGATGTNSGFGVTVGRTKG